MSIEEVEKKIVEEFESFDDWMDKYEHIINLGKSLGPLDSQFKNDAYRITGCQSNVWVHAYVKNGRMMFEADSDTLITKGLIALLIRVLSDRTPDEIIGAKLEFIEKVGLSSHLSPMRSNGLKSMVNEINLHTFAYKKTL